MTTRSTSMGDAHELTSRRSAALWAGAALAVLLLIASGLGYRAVSAAIARELVMTVKLDPPLSTLPHMLGAWQGVDVDLRESVQKIAGNDDFVNRSYRNAQTGEAVMLYVGYTARPRTMLRHRPTVCYPSAGYTHVGTERLALQIGGNASPALLHRFYKPGLTESRVVVLNYYVLNGAVTTDENSFWGIGWRDPKLAREGERYVAQIQVITPIASSEEAATAAVQRFATDSAPFILSLLPETGVGSPAQTAGQN